jgi:dihydrodipicolinate synthase/N-acetylneuraminate lyase
MQNPETTTTGNTGPGTNIAPEFATWPVTADAAEKVNKAREIFSKALAEITTLFPSGNQRYLAIVKTNLETASLFTIKGITMPPTTNNNNGGKTNG